MTDESSAYRVRPPKVGERVEWDIPSGRTCVGVVAWAAPSEIGVDHGPPELRVRLFFQLRDDGLFQHRRCGGFGILRPAKETT